MTVLYADADIDPIEVHIGERLRRRRKEVKVTQKDLASYLGVTPQQVQKYEAGVTRITASMLLRAGYFLWVPFHYFFFLRCPTQPC